ncbi:hypothetical protein SO694_0034304 [Aureococcus anophagefferens]|uniref:Uncharacterized protein n=1 Tax=Aureococcus anophagefferens TaxID=44056 RepID=A0ABR1G549_AURAN
MTVSEQWRNAFVLCPATDLEVVERMAQRAEEAGYAATLVGLKRWAETQPTAEDDEAPLLRSLATKSLEGEAAEASRRRQEKAKKAAKAEQRAAAAASPNKEKKRSAETEAAAPAAKKAKAAPGDPAAAGRAALSSPPSSAPRSPAP